VSSLGLEKLALREFVNERADATALLLCPGDNGGELLSVAEGKVASRRIDGELPRKVLQQQRRVGGSKLLKFADVTELSLVG